VSRFQTLHNTHLRLRLRGQQVASVYLFLFCDAACVTGSWADRSSFLLCL